MMEFLLRTFKFINLLLIKLKLMLTQQKSTPKMRKSYTPRVKSAHIDHDDDRRRAQYFTNRKNEERNSNK